MTIFRRDDQFFIPRYLETSQLFFRMKLTKFFLSFLVVKESHAIEPVTTATVASAVASSGITNIVITCNPIAAALASFASACGVGWKYLGKNLFTVVRINVITGKVSGDVNLSAK